MKSIDAVFNAVKKKYRLKNFYLASGGLYDVKGPGTSDVDIVYMVDDYMNLDDVFAGAEKEPRPDKNRCYYKFKMGGREVSICASNDQAVMRSVTHRNNELMLNGFPLLAACAVNAKLGGMKTEQAWAFVLGIAGDPYDALAQPKAALKAIAKKKEAKLQQIMRGLVATG